MPERYTILRELGRGAIGTIYAAHDRSTGAVVALKTLDPALLREAGAELAGLFLENARSAAGLRHRNIVRVFDAGEVGGTAYVAMELVEGESLRRMLDQAPLAMARAIQIFDDIASALAYAHEERMVHRGVKPTNIIVSSEGVAKLGDFGTGQIGEAALPYMSPEQVRGDPIDHRSDLFSLGATFYEMLTGRAAFAGDSPDEIRQNILRAAPPPASTVNPHVPSALDALISRLLAARPDERFANARDLLRELQRLEDALGLRPAASPSTAEPTPNVPTVRPLMEDRIPGPEPSSGSRIASSLAALALMLAVLSIGFTVFLHYSPDLTERVTVAATVPEPAPPPAPVTEAIREEVAAPEPPAPETEEASTVAAEPVPPVPVVAEPEQPATAKLVIAVSPRGELYIDGEHHGATPPLRALDLEPGMHRIEIRNGSRKPYLTYVTVKAGDERRIRHDFAAKRIRPPG